MKREIPPVEFVMTRKGWYHLWEYWWENCGQKKCQWIHP